MNIPKIVEKWDGIIYQAYNVLSSAKFYLLPGELKKLIKNNKKYKDAYEGKRCFIVLNGPSINSHDLKSLGDEMVFASNYFYRSSLCKLVKPNFYCWLDSNIFVDDGYREIFDEINALCPNAQLFINSRGYKKNCDIKNANYTFNRHFPNCYSLKVNISRRVSNFATVALYCMAIAIYMGFKKIYVLGLDFEPGAFKHFTNLGEGTECDDPTKKSDKYDVCGNYWSYAKSHFEFYKMNEIAKKHGASIINLNSNSCVRAFSFQKYEDIINKNE